MAGECAVKSLVRKKEKISEDRRKQIGKIVLAVLFVLVFGFLMEFFFRYPAIRAVSRGETAAEEIPFTQAEYAGFTWSNEEERLVLAGDSDFGYVRIPLDGKYVGKFFYSYEYDGLLNLTARAGVYNAYGEVRERDILSYTDRNSRNVKTSWLKVGKRADYIELSISREQLREEGLSYLNLDAYPVALTGFGTAPDTGLNWYRLCFFWCAAGLPVLLIFFRKAAAGRIEIGFLLISLTVGTLFSFSLPANKVSWDEEVHFSQAFWIAHYRTPVPVSYAALQEFITGIDTWPYNQPDSREEQQELNRYLDEEADYRTGDQLWSTDLNKATMTGYAGQGIFLKIGSLLHLPFSVLFKFGRLGNLYLYCIILYFAIKKTPVGKAAMAFLGLMPEPMMLAGVYSYDPTVTAFLYLAFAWLLSAVLKPDGKMTWKTYGVMMLAFFWGCRIKAVYAPLILIGLLIPKERFRSKKERLLMKGGFLALCLLLMLSFVLPVVIAPRDIGDLRGGATSEAGQMSYILGQPLAYAQVLLANMWRTLPSYVLGENALGLLGHQGKFAFPWLLYAGSTAVILTGGQSACGKRLDWKQKLWIFLLIGGTAVLVWTSMYIAFTIPGNTYIEGVQGRYYMPFLFLAWLVFTPGWLTVHLKQEDYYGLVLGLGGAVLLAAYYTGVLTAFCL